MRTNPALALVFLLASTGLSRASELAAPGLPIKPAAATPAATPTAAPAENVLALDDIDRLVAEERARLQSVPAVATSMRLAPPVVPPPRVEVAIGVTSTLSVGLNQVNRIVAPFNDLRVQHQSNATAKKQGSVVYITPTDTQPFVVYLEDKTDPTRTIGLLLRPHPDMPPVQVALDLPGYVPSAPVLEAPEAPDHIAGVRRVLRDLAAGQVPQGYALRGFGPGDPEPRCVIPGVLVRPAQVVSGGTLVVVVAHIENTSAGDIALEEAACADDAVVAVAAYPYTELAPGQAGELMVAYRARPVDAARARPSLIGATP